MTDLAARVLRLARQRVIVRPRDLNAIGVPRSYLARLVAAGKLEHPARGVYRLPRGDVTEHHALAVASARVPHGVICLLSALRFHDLTTQSPFEVWLAIDPKARAPRLDDPPLRIVRMHKSARSHGVERHTVEGVVVSITSPARTVVDCFKFRNKIGLDVALEALRDFRRRRGNVDELWRHARRLRLANVMRPYMEALA
jgi:predicted transcriptional regulator of viral defense system